MILGQEEKPSLAELAHHGVKGMKWGVRRNRVTTSDIKSARARQASRVHQINDTASRLNLAPASKQQALAKKFHQQKTEFLRSPDRATAMRITRGEKVALALLTIPTGAIAPAAGLAQYGARKGVEAHQRKLAKNKGS